MIPEFMRNPTPSTKRLMKVSFFAGLICGIICGALYYYRVLRNKPPMQQTQVLHPLTWC